MSRDCDLQGIAKLSKHPALPSIPHWLSTSTSSRCNQAPRRVKALVAAGEEFDGSVLRHGHYSDRSTAWPRRPGVSVPSSVKVIGFDNVEEGNFTVPSLSSVDPDHDLMARTAVSLLVRRIDERCARKDHQEFVSNFKVVERESTRA